MTLLVEQIPTTIIVFAPCSQISLYLPLTAEGGSDFSTAKPTLTFRSCDEMSCLNISITNDAVMEELVEEFKISLESANTDTRVRVSAQPSTVRITDDDGLPLY